MYFLFKPDNWRYERKFLVSELDRHEIEAIVKQHPAMFSEIFYQRTVNNLYIDSINYGNYFDNVIGSSKRLKTRIRWYGELFGYIKKPVLEVKLKDGFLGSKISYPLEPMNMLPDFSHDTLQSLFEKSSQLPDRIKAELLHSELSLLNNYKRKYFQSADKKFRITIDTEMRFFKIERHHNTFLNQSVDYANTVLELKYTSENDERAKNITAFFPFRMTRSSKYVTGVDRLNWN